MITLWKGSCNQWDCDEMGHMNVRVYVEKQMEALAVLAGAIGLPHAFEKDAPATLRPVDQHIRFMAEVLPGKPISLSGQVLEVSETGAVVFQAMHHADGRLAAAFRTRIAHIDTAESEAFKWPTRARAALNGLIEPAPETAAPRSIDPDAPGLKLDDITYDRIRAVGAPLIGKGAVPIQHCDAQGYMAPAWFIGRVSDSVPNLLHGWREKIGKAAGGTRMGAAVLEYRLRYHRFPRTGAQFEIFSALGATEGKTHALVHWVMDPETGLPWATAQATAITLDLDQRKAIPAPPEYIAELERLAPRGLTL